MLATNKILLAALLCCAADQLAASGRRRSKPEKDIEQVGITDAQQDPNWPDFDKSYAAGETTRKLFEHNKRRNKRPVARRLGDGLSCNRLQASSSFGFFSSSSGGTKLAYDADLTGLDFDPKRKTYVLFHGWFGCSFSDYQISFMNNKVAQPGGANVFITDWSHSAHDVSYRNAIRGMWNVASDTLQLLTNLEGAYPGFNKTNIHIVGFSLGAHVAGQLGWMLDGQATQITGLDPAGVQFAEMHPKYKLTADDAKFVIALHTSINFYGTKWNAAQFDVFVNGGRNQPACQGLRRLRRNVCDHRHAPEYFAGAGAQNAGRCEHVAYLCQNWPTFASGQCGFCAKNSTSDCIPMTPDLDNDSKEHQRTLDTPWTFGEEDHRYYAATSAREPFCVFAYQLIVKFSPDFQPSANGDWAAKVSFGGAEDHIIVESFKKLETGEALTHAGTISGPNLYTALLMVENSHIHYNLMPKPASSIKLNLLQRDEKVEVYSNFMSSSDYETRRKNSAQIKQVEWEDG